MSTAMSSPSAPKGGRPRPQVITLTDAAVTRIRHIMDQNPDNYALRLGVKKGGCAGMEYTLDWVREAGRFDEVVESSGARVLIDPSAVLFLIGSQMDFKTEKLTSGFVFTNPNQTSACGCGESIELKAADAKSLEALRA
ncbi:MAG: Fe-S cluster assembly scaffold SufA [Hyphomicrobiaceae bacterium]